MSFRDALNSQNDDLNKFDTATTGDADLAAFDEATGATHIPAGWYDCTLVCGERHMTKKGKSAYRLILDVADGSHRGHRLWRYFTFDTPANANRAKAALAPFGLKTSADLKKPFPGPGRSITLRALVTALDRPDGLKGNNIERFEVTEDKTITMNPNAVNPDDFMRAEGGKP
jgi:hypothetical protein